MPCLQNQCKEMDASVWSFKPCVFKGFLNKNELNVTLEVSLSHPPPSRERAS